MKRDPLSAGPARQRPPLPLLTTLRFFANFFLYFGFVARVSVAVFRQIETPMRKWIAGHDRECSHRVAVATVAGGGPIFCVPEGGRGKDHSEDHQVCSRNDCS
jgi:hypothetical protein